MQANAPSPSRAARTRRPLPFDTVVLASIGGLLALLAFVVVLGDRVGVTIDRVAPLGEGARSTAPILVHFSEAMQRETAEARFRIEPAVPGVFRWSTRQLNFQPSAALTPGQTYTVTMDAGALSEGGRTVLSAYTFQFTVRRPRVAYLYPTDSLPQNIWIADPADPASAQQVTFSPTTVFDFSVSPDGSQIAFSEKNADGTSNIKLLTLETGALVQVTNCPDSDCTTPVWRPDGDVIAYERIDFNSTLENVGTSPTRIWLIELNTLSAESAAQNRPLFSDGQILGFNAQWSADGQRIALYNAASQGEILIYDFPTGSLTAVPSTAGQSGALSPDGNRIVYPEILITEGSAARAYLRVADLQSGRVGYLSQPGDPVDDRRAQWRPDGRMLAVARSTEATGRGFQIVLVNPDDGTSTPVTDDPRYSNQLFYWNPNGTALVVQRFPEFTAEGAPNNLGRPEIWTIDAETGEGTFIASNGYLPRWVP
jgi:Tol biopolymer transport system component